MSVKRTTFSESWYRVAELSPRLHPCLQSYRQYHRGEQWYILEDPVSNGYFRISYAAYNFLALLDGERTVAKVWDICNDKFGDEAPTQGEVIQLLGQLHSTNLLFGDIPVDSSGLLKRYKQRRQKEITGQIRGFLFMKIPLWDPDRFLRIFSPLCGLLFTASGMFLWTALALLGIVYALANTADLSRQDTAMLSASNLPWLYLCFAIIKVLHELGHGFACKKFGLDAGSDGPVHTMGVMLMLLTPIPYVDCSSSWALRSKWQRVIVGGAGMLVELMIAAVAVIVWSQTSEGSLIHSLAYNVMFVTSVSTLLFNGNPLLRYDAYYMLSDILEIPNLASRSNNYFFYIFKKYVFGIKDSFHPAEGGREKFWLFTYAIAAFIYRIVIMVSITLFLTDLMFALGVFFAVGGVFKTFIKPVWQFARYLLTSPELARNRPRALVISGIFSSLILAGVFLYPVADRIRIEGVVEPKNIKIVYALTDGFLTELEKSGSHCEKGKLLLKAENPVLENDYEKQTIQLKELAFRYKLAQTQNIAESQVYLKQIKVLKENLKKGREKIAKLSLVAPGKGVWIHEDLESFKGSYLQKGTELGKFVNLEDMLVRAVAPQEHAQILRNAESSLEIRIKGRPDLLFTGEVTKSFPVGQQNLPSAALGYAVGGELQTSAADQDGKTSAEKVFELHVEPSADSIGHIYSGQILILRFDLAPKSLAEQGIRSLKQSFQKRFNIL